MHQLHWKLQIKELELVGESWTRRCTWIYLNWWNSKEWFKFIWNRVVSNSEAFLLFKIQHSPTEQGLTYWKSSRLSLKKVEIFRNWVIHTTEGFELFNLQQFEVRRVEIISNRIVYDCEGFKLFKAK